MLYLKVFNAECDSLREVIKQLNVGEAEEILSESRLEYEEVASVMPYIDDPEHSMAAATFICCSYLAIFLSLRSRGVDAHTWGKAIYSTPSAESLAKDSAHRFIADAEKSLVEAKDNEFVFEFVQGDGTPNEWGMNVKSCALCVIYTKYSAMDLLPYMCAGDDIDSKNNNQGLRRSGTIGLGAHECDFKYKVGGTPAPLALQFPDKIRFV